MTRGLVKTNNLSDLQHAEQARINLGLATNDYLAIKGLFISSGVSNLDIQKIANSTSNFQGQIDSAITLLATIDPSLYANKTGDTLTGTWSNQGAIGASGIIASGITLSGSSDALFSRSSPLSSLGLETLSGVTIASGISVNNLTASGNIITTSGIVATSNMRIQVNGVNFRIEVA